MRARRHRSVRHAAGEQEDADPDHHLAREHPPPRGVCGRESADQGPTAIAIAPAAPTRP